jgi:anti-sigma factor RsiW
MNCRRIEELIPLFVEGDLEKGEAEQVAFHLETCSACAGLAAEFRESQNWLLSFDALAFSEAELDDLKQGVMAEIQRRNGQEGFLRRFVDRWTLRQMVAATAAVLILCAALAIYVYNGKGSRVIDSSGEVAKETRAPSNDSPDVARQNEDLNEAAGASSRSQARVRSTGVMKKSRRNSRSASSRLPVFASRPEKQRVETPDAQGEVKVAPEMLRIEIQTADPNIRIIWFAPKQADTNQSRPMTD